MRVLLEEMLVCRAMSRYYMRSVRFFDKIYITVVVACRFGAPPTVKIRMWRSPDCHFEVILRVLSGPNSQSGAPAAWQKYIREESVYHYSTTKSCSQCTLGYLLFSLFVLRKYHRETPRYS
jgi:hypothetical protein